MHRFTVKSPEQYGSQPEKQRLAGQRTGGASRTAQPHRLEPPVEEYPKPQVWTQANELSQVAFLPNLGRTGNVLAISGTEVEGTEGGGEFVTNARSMAQLRQYVRPDRDGRFPYFEILLKSSRVSGATTGVNIMAFRSPRM